ncbi:hypothetical protein ACFQVC_08050 [Streptomyces monticola]|uniref:Uncharacterized protein n=1 Tax=Streptomyces monticola TaxID=2666263 RepID=A0ABW2JEY6_9ACTN
MVVDAMSGKITAVRSRIVTRETPTYEYAAIAICSAIAARSAAD